MAYRQIHKKEDEDHPEELLSWPLKIKEGWHPLEGKSGEMRAIIEPEMLEAVKSNSPKAFVDLLSSLKIEIVGRYEAGCANSRAGFGFYLANKGQRFGFLAVSGIKKTFELAFANLLEELKRLKIESGDDKKEFDEVKRRFESFSFRGSLSSLLRLIRK